MRVKLLVSLAGQDFVLSPGDRFDCDNAEAVRLIEAGFAVPDAEPKVERAVKKPAVEKRKK